MNPIIDTLKTTLDVLRDLDAASIQRSAYRQADSFLGNYGYSRGPSPAMQILTHTASFGVGMAVGAGLGVVLAPKAGAGTREDLKTATTDAMQTVGDFVTDVMGTKAPEDAPEETTTAGPSPASATN